MKKKITEDIFEEHFDLEGSIETAIKKLQKFKKGQEAKGWFNIKLYPAFDIDAKGTRYETDQEEKARMRAATIDKKQKADLKKIEVAKERAIYLALKKKFEK